jgi:hypothetical protein
MPLMENVVETHHVPNGTGKTVRVNEGDWIVSSL